MTARYLKRAVRAPAPPAGAAAALHRQYHNISAAIVRGDGGDIADTGRHAHTRGAFETLSAVNASAAKGASSTPTVWRQPHLQAPQSRPGPRAPQPPAPARHHTHASSRRLPHMRGEAQPPSAYIIISTRYNTTLAQSQSRQRGTSPRARRHLSARRHAARDPRRRFSSRWLGGAAARRRRAQSRAPVARPARRGARPRPVLLARGGVSWTTNRGSTAQFGAVLARETAACARLICNA